MFREIMAKAHSHVPTPRPLHAREIELLNVSGREAEVLGLIARGLSTREAADELFLSVNSVKTHTRNLFVKLGVSSRTQAAVWMWSRPEGWWAGD